VIEHLRDRDGFGQPASGCVEADHEGRIAPAAGLVDRLLEVVHGGTVNRAIDDGQEDSRPLGSGRRQRRGENDGREGEDQADAGPSRRSPAHSFLSPFLASAAVRDATSPVMSPAAVVFVTTIMFFSRAISVRVCNSRSRIADGAEPYSMAASRIFSAAWNSPSAMMTLDRRSRSASACFAIARTIV